MHHVLLGIVAAGALLRLAVACWVSQHPGLYTMDDPYQDLAWSLIGGHGFTRPGDPWPVALWPPGYPLFLAGLFAVTGGSALAALLGNAILGCLSIGLVFAIGHRLVGSRAGLLAAAIYALDWLSIGYVTRLASESLGTALLLVGIWLWIRFLREDRLLLALGCGSAFGAAIMVRPVSAVAALPLWTASFLISRKSLLRVGVIGTAMFAVCLPWCVRNQVLFGRFQLSCSGPYKFAASWTGRAHVRSLGKQWVDNTPELDRYYPGWREWDPFRSADARVALAMRWARQHPWTLAKYVLLGFAETLAGSVVGPRLPPIYDIPVLLKMGAAWSFLMASLAALGLVRMVRRRGEALVWLMLALAVVLIVGAAGADGYARFRVPAVPLLAILAAASIPWAGNRRPSEQLGSTLDPPNSY